MPENKILVIRGGAIGDFILTLPVLAALRRQFPRTRLEVLGYPHIARLAVAGGLADDVRPIESRALAGFFARGGELDGALQDYFASFAIILSFLYDPDGIFEANVKRCSRAQFIAGPHRPDDNAGVHATEVFLKPLKHLAIFDADPVPRLTLNRESELETGGTGDWPVPSGDPPGGMGWTHPRGGAANDNASALHVPCGGSPRGTGGSPVLPAHECSHSSRLAFHPGSGSERKNWPERRWSQLLHDLAAATSRRFLLVGGEAEGDRLNRLAQDMPSGRCEILSCHPLPEVARRLAGCAAFVGHDSGISHLAAALGLPGIALWGDTAAAVWRPRSARFQIVHAPGDMASLSVEDLMAAIRALPMD